MVLFCLGESGMDLKRSTLVFITLIIQTLIIAGMIHLQSYDVAKMLVCGFIFADICGALAWVVEDF